MAVEGAIANTMVEATKGEYRSGHDPRTLRDALGCFATGVTVVTCLDTEGAPAGLTVNSFTSVSLDPPLLLVCVKKTASSAAALTSAESFAINVLQTGQQPASIRFAARDEDRFGTTPWSCGEGGAPILAESLCVFECERFAVYDGGDHHILVGKVVKASFDAGLDPLLYFRGRYRRLHFD
jgi:flavin reductase (DIM6/NTAB) family NADH-FMN oxidoreductase RutF